MCEPAFQQQMTYVHRLRDLLLFEALMAKDADELAKSIWVLGPAGPSR